MTQEILHIEVPIQLTREDGLWVAEVMIPDFFHIGVGETQKEAVERVQGYYVAAMEGWN